VAFEWDLGNGTSQVSGPRANAVFSRAGSYPVSVTVVDDSGGRSTRSLSLVVSSSGAPSTAVDSAQSTMVAATSSPLASAITVITVTTRNALGLPVAAMPVWLSGRGREWRVTQPAELTSALGVTSGTVTTAISQTAQVVAIADHTLLRSIPVSIGPTAPSPSRSTVRRTDPVVAAAGDTTLIEVTARDTEGNPLVGATVTVSVTGGTSTVRNEGPTDANGRRVVTIEPTSCGGATLVATASVNGTALSTTANITAAAPAAYGVCGAALWLDADDNATLTQSGGSLSGWLDKSGAARHGATGVGPTVVASGFNGRTALRFNGTSQFVLLPDVASLTPYTVFVVERRRSARGTNFIIGGTTPTAFNNLLLGYQTGTSVRFAPYTANLDGAVPMFAGIAAEPGRVLVGRWSSGARSLMSNGALLASDASVDPLATWAGAAIGRANIDGTLSHYEGDVGELLIFRRALSDTERTAISQSLMRKWALGTLSLAAGDNQTATVGEAVAIAPQVRVVNDAGVGLAGASVVWQVTTGGGTIGSTLTTTDANGFASVPWTLGTSASQTLTAWYGATAGSGQSVTFTAATASCAYGVCSPVLWLDAQDASTVWTSFGRASQWRDKSSAAHIATPATGDGGPIYQASANAGMNGRAAMVFASPHGTMSLRVTPVLAPEITVFVVGRSYTSAWNAAGWLVNARGPNGFMVSPELNVRQVTPSIVDAAGSPSAMAGVTPHNIRIPHLYGLSYAAPSAISLLDGAVSTSTISMSRVAAAVDVFIGRDMCCGRGGGLGSIGELLIYNRALTTAERQLVERAIMARWGIGTLAVSWGDLQSVPTGTSPGLAPTVRLSDATGEGIAGSPVTWQVTAGGARFGATTTFSTTTDGDGFATVPTSGALALTVGSGSNQITAWLSATAGQGRSAVFTLTGTP
jgi:hypothetical protein